MREILEGEIGPGLSSVDRAGIPLYSAHQIEAIFEWAASRSRKIEWVGAFFIGDAYTQPSIEHSAELRDHPRYEEFRAQCLLLSSRLIADTKTHGKEPMFEVGISN